MQDGQTQPSQTEVPKGHLHIKHVGLLYVALVVVSFVAVVVTGLGVYYLQQGQIDSLSKALSDAHNQKTGSTKGVITQMATFTRPNLPFTFTYPENWVVVGDHPFVDDTKANSYSQYSFALYIPGAVIDETTIGGPATTKGSRINISATKTQYKNLSEFKKNSDFVATAKDVRDSAVSDLVAVRYTWAFEGPVLLKTTVIKDGWQYTISMDAEGEEANSPSLPDYEALVKSFKFN